MGRSRNSRHCLLRFGCGYRRQVDRPLAIVVGGGGGDQAAEGRDHRNGGYVIHLLIQARPEVIRPSWRRREVAAGDAGIARKVGGKLVGAGRAVRVGESSRRQLAEWLSIELDWKIAVPHPVGTRLLSHDDDPLYV